jgi:hypothetical protein
LPYRTEKRSKLFRLAAKEEPECTFKATEDPGEETARRDRVAKEVRQQGNEREARK